MKNQMIDMLRNIPSAVKFELQNDSHVELVIYDARGKILRNFIRFSEKKGAHSIKWDGLDNQGNEVDRGLYYYKMLVNNEVVSDNMVLIK